MTSAVNKLQLGSKVFPNNLIQGPLAGVSCAPFRRLITLYSQPAFTCSEMISCQTLIHQTTKAHRRFVMKATDEGPVCFQLAGSEVADVAMATKIASDYGADLIDLNCGCPVKKIRSKKAGSSLLLDPVRLYQLIHALKQNTTVPVSIKIRVQGQSDEKFNQEIVKVVSDAGADFLVVHGRHWTENYATPCRHDEIKFFVDQLKIPVIGNGDIACISSLKAMLATGCAGVMISRASVGQPWLIKKLIAELNQENCSIPSLDRVGLIFIEHVTHLAELLQNEKLAILQARKFAKYYARRLPDKIEFCSAINTCDKLPDFSRFCENFFKKE